MNKMINYLILVSYLLFYHILLLPTGYINIVSYLQIIQIYISSHTFKKHSLISSIISHIISKKIY